jgi:hypothetical protein
MQRNEVLVAIQYELILEYRYDQQKQNREQFASILPNVFGT